MAPMKCRIVTLAVGFLAITQSFKYESKARVRKGLRDLQQTTDLMYQGFSSVEESQRKHSKKEEDPPLTPEPSSAPEAPEVPGAPEAPEQTDSTPPPTEELWDITMDSEGNLISSCKVLPEGNSTDSAFSQAIDFDYYMYLSESETSDIDAQIATVEVQLHAALTEKALSCSLEDGDTLIAALSSEGADTLVGECQDATPEASETCWQIRAQITVVMASSLSDPELFALFFEWIEESLETAVNGTITNIEFRGFPNSDLDDGNVLPGSDVTSPSGNDLSVAAAQGNIPLSEPPSQSLGPFVLAIAATVLVLLSVLVYRRRKRQTAFSAQSEEVTEIAMDTPPAPESKRQVTFVNDRDILCELDADGFEVMDEEPRHQAITVHDKEMGDGSDFSGFEVVDDYSDERGC